MFLRIVCNIATASVHCESGCVVALKHNPISIHNNREILTNLSRQVLALTIHC